MADPVSLVVSPIVDRIIGSAASLIEEELRLVLGLKEDVENLESNLRAIRAVLQDAENKQFSETEGLRDWLEKLQSAAYDAEDVLDIFVTKASLWRQKQKVRNIRPPLSASKICFQSATAHDVKKISARIKMINEEKDKFKLEKSDATNSVGESSHNHPRTDSFVNPIDVVGRESDKEKIMNLLLSDESDIDDKVSVIPIFGSGGLGKTALAQYIFNHRKVQELFGYDKIWICVTAEFNEAKILQDIMKNYPTMKLPSKLSSHTHLVDKFVSFLREKRYFLVLDDVWNEDHEKWESLWKYLKNGRKGSKILVTTRSEKVARLMATKSAHKHRLGLLGEDECWSLFQKIAFTDDYLSIGRRKKLEDIGQKIVCKCERLPLAVKAMGCLLRGIVDVERWEKILESHIWELEGGTVDMKPKILPALKLSYDYLPSYLKHCFAYCSIFPKGHAFDKDELVKLWMAQNFIRAGGVERKEVLGCEYFDELQVRSFFQARGSGDKDRYYMHDCMHDLAQFIASSSRYYCFMEDKKSCGGSEDPKDYRHVSLLLEDVEQPCLKIVQNSKKLRTLLFPSEYPKDFGQALKRIFDELRFLRVLDLSSSRITELPNSIRKLKLLRFLDLSGTEISALPNSICHLYNLQTLKLLRCSCLIELPKDLRKLVNLRNLELDDIFWFKSTTLPRGIGNLSILHNLHAFHFQVGHKSGYGIRELKDMTNLTGRLHISKLENAVKSGDCQLSHKEKLHKLVLEWSDRKISHAEAAQEQVLEGLQPHSNLKKLQICHYQGAKFPAWMTDRFLQNLVTVSLTHCSKCKILSFSELPCLKELFIKGMLELEKFQYVECLRLTYLKFSNCPKLSELPESLPDVHLLKIKRCNSLKSLPITSWLSSLVLVDNLGLEDLNEQGSISEVKIINCPNLQALRKGFSPSKLQIIGCKLLNTFPHPYFGKNLRRFALEGCNDETLVKAISSVSFLESLFISNVSNLAAFPKWPHLARLEALYVHDCRELVSLSEEVEESFLSLTSLKVLSIQGCPELVKLPDEGLPTALEFLSIGSCHNLVSLGAEGTLTSLTSLRDFYIEDCPKIHCFPEDGLPTSLQHLRIQKCPKLTKRWLDVNGEDPEWLKIKDSAQEFPKKKESSAWCHPIVCGTGMKFKGKMEPGESSSSAQNSKNRSINFKTKKAAATTMYSQFKKTWIDKKSGYNCIMLYPMSLNIAWVSKGEYWSWNWFKEKTGEYIEVAQLRAVCWLDVSGKVKMSELSPGVEYEIVFVVKLATGAYGWGKHPLVLKLSVHGKNAQEHKVFPYEKARRGWTELSLGKFFTENGNTTEVGFDLLEHGGHWKSGLIIKGVILRPVNN